MDASVGSPARKYALKELLAGITAANVHDETGTGLDIGHEIAGWLDAPPEPLRTKDARAHK